MGSAKLIEADKGISMLGTATSKRQHARQFKALQVLNLARNHINDLIPTFLDEVRDLPGLYLSFNRSGAPESSLAWFTTSDSSLPKRKHDHHDTPTEFYVFFSAPHRVFSFSFPIFFSLSSSSRVPSPSLLPTVGYYSPPPIVAVVCRIRSSLPRQLPAATEFSLLHSLNNLFQEGEKQGGHGLKVKDAFTRKDLEDVAKKLVEEDLYERKRV
ncbi:hypothetical protein L2E82_42314 [Cichorium intybus]|uniref:Uncharacterized protein n=1 Tax=Cichorium intybus TaxID=13427 RepID=A0ACB8ZKZ1_CICIN|nr:hypothetical protein L2E82_42314 [Cichorium intybus]